MTTHLIRPTDLPAGHRRTVHVDVTIPRPTTVASTFRAAARLLSANGLHQGDYFPNAFSDKTTPYATRPLSIVGAIRCAAVGNPRAISPLTEEALLVLAKRLEVAGDGPFWGAATMVEFHVDAWGDAEGRTTESAVAVLYAAADASEQVAA